MSRLHNLPRATELFKRKHGTLRDYSNKHKVTVDWDLNTAAKADQIFRLTIDGVDVYLDAEEVMHYIRMV